MYISYLLNKILFASLLFSLKFKNYISSAVAYVRYVDVIRL
jgi:hypothetical protein